MTAVVLEPRVITELLTAAFLSNPGQYTTVQKNFQTRFSVNVWCGIVNVMLTGPAIVEDRMTRDSYLQFLYKDLNEHLEDVPLDTRRHMYLQHDGSPILYTRNITQHLNNTYANRWIGRCSLIHWPARSPDLTPLDFCLWGWLKGEVYHTKVDTCADLVTRINNACVRIKMTAVMSYGVQHSLPCNAFTSALRLVAASLKICYEMCQTSTVQGFVHCRSTVTQASVKVVKRDALLGRILNAADRI